MDNSDTNHSDLHPLVNESEHNPQHSAPGAARQAGVQKVVITVLLLLASAVIFILPNSVTEPWVNYSSPTETPAASLSASTVSPSTAAQKTKYRQDAQTLLAEIIVRRDRLQEKRVELWGDFEFKQAILLIEDGDQHYQYGEYAKSIASYQSALDGLGSLETAGDEILASAIDEASNAIEASVFSTATRAIELASAMAPENSQIQQISQRVASLPTLIEAMEQGEKYSAVDQLSAAREAFVQAVTVDPQHKKAAAALAKTEQKITQQRFRDFMSQGYKALDQNDFKQATAAFERAGTVYADHPAIAQAQAQLETRRSQLWVSDNMRRAEALAAQEQWQQAQTVYQKLLAADATLTDVKVKQIPVNVRADLDRRIKEIIRDPLALANSNQLRKAQKTLEDATGIASPGPLLKNQIDSLRQIIKSSQTPIEVALASDSNTDVTLFRVARLGAFATASVSLKPGRYIAAGTRRGYRDVRIEFTVTDKGFDSPITISCNEAI